MRTTRRRAQGRSLRALTMTLVLALLAALLLAGTALAATPGKPTAKAPKGAIITTRPTFKWSRAARATKYEVRAYKGSKLLLKKAGITRLSWKSSEALPKYVSLTWKVRARNAGGNGAWSKSLRFKIPTDYSRPARWLSLPTTVDKKVDVFYLYPSEYTKAAPSAPIVGPIDDPGMMQGAQVAFQRQATAFRTFATIYAPYYRQADAASRAALPQKEQVKIVAGAPTQDGIAAFDYYIRHFNHGRPFILAGHSLGSNVLANLLSQYMKRHPDVYKRMVAAYVVGYSITPDYLARNPHLKFARGANDTQVIVSWNTEAPTVDGTNPVLLPGGLVINPITWTRKETEATAAQNLGSIELNKSDGGTPVLDKNGHIARVMNLADAQIDKAKGVVICSTVNPSEYQSEGVYHTFDYPFYFFNIRENAANRFVYYLSKN